MSNLKLSDLRAEVNKDYGPWLVTFGTAEKPRESAYNHPLLASSAERREYSDLMLAVARFTSGQVSEEDLKRFEKFDGDEYQYLADRVEKTFAALAVNKNEHKALAREVKGDFAMWERILLAFMEHYGDTPGESTPSVNS